MLLEFLFMWKRNKSEITLFVFRERRISRIYIWMKYIHFLSSESIRFNIVIMSVLTNKFIKEQEECYFLPSNISLFFLLFLLLFRITILQCFAISQIKFHGEKQFNFNLLFLIYFYFFNWSRRTIETINYSNCFGI